MSKHMSAGLVSVFNLHRDAIKADGAENDDNIEAFLFEEVDGTIAVNSSVKSVYYDDHTLKAEALLLEPKYAGVLDDDYYRVYYACVSHNITALKLFIEYVDQHRSEYDTELLNLYLIGGALNCCENGDIDSIMLILERFGENICVPLLECAYQLGDIEVIKCLIEEHREALLVPVPSILRLASEHGDADVVDILVSNYGSDLARPVCINAFNRACERGHLSVVQTLVTSCRDIIDFKSNTDYRFDRNKTNRCQNSSEIYEYLNAVYGTSITGSTYWSRFLQRYAEWEMRNLPPYAS